MVASHAEKVADSHRAVSLLCVTALLYSGGGFVISLGVLTIAGMILKLKPPERLAYKTKERSEMTDSMYEKAITHYQSLHLMLAETVQI